MPAMYGSVVHSTYTRHILEPVATTKVCGADFYAIHRKRVADRSSAIFETSRIVNSRSRVRLWLVLRVEYHSWKTSPLGVTMLVLVRSAGFRIGRFLGASSKRFKSGFHSEEQARKWINIEIFPNFRVLNLLLLFPTIFFDLPPLFLPDFYR